MDGDASNPGRHATARRTFHQWVCALALCVAASTTCAAPVFKCVDAHGHLAYRDTPCAARATQTRIDLQPQPTIGDAGEVAAERARNVSIPHRRRTIAHPRRHSARHTRSKPRMSWKCRAADGEVFYRHKRCPGSVPGDGTVRIHYAATTSGNQSRRHRSAWSSVRVHATRISRTKACRRIHGVGASSRDGHLRDATVSVYDHLMGRDPCIGA